MEECPAISDRRHEYIMEKKMVFNWYVDVLVRDS